MSRRCIVGESSFYRSRSSGIDGLQGSLTTKVRVGSSESAVAERDQVIGELTAANRNLQKVGQLKVDETLKSMVQGELLADRDSQV